GVAPETVPALEADLRAAAARHGAHLEVTSGGAADLETVLLDLMDADHPAAAADGSAGPTSATTRGTGEDARCAHRVRPPPPSAPLAPRRRCGASSPTATSRRGSCCRTRSS